MNKSTRINGIVYAFTMLLFILDAKTVIAGAGDGITLCLKTVIPSLLPFIILSCLITGSVSGKPIKIMRPLGKLCRIPAGAESVMLLGFIGGYPVGAQSVYYAWKAGVLKEDDARRMLGFCNNAGPAFLFGMTSALFSPPTVPWALWIIHIAAAIIVGTILPGKPSHIHTNGNRRKMTPSQAVEYSIGIMARICTWVIVFRVIIAILDRWLLFAMPLELGIAISGLLELSNGCVGLYSVPVQGVRFVMCACFLSFGGLSVAFQTLSVTKELGAGSYFPGKILQAMISFLLAVLAQYYLFPASEWIYCPTVIILAVAAGIVLCTGFLRKKQ